MQGANTKATWPTTPTQNIKPSHAPKNGHQNRTDVLTIRPPMKQNQSVEASNKTALRNFTKTRRNLAFSMGEVRGKDWQIHRRQVPANIRLVFSTTVKSIIHWNETYEHPPFWVNFNINWAQQILLSSLSWLHALQMRLENRGAGLQRKICKCRRWIQLSFSQPCFSEFFRDTSTYCQYLLMVLGICCWICWIQVQSESAWFPPLFHWLSCPQPRRTWFMSLRNYLTAFDSPNLDAVFAVWADFQRHLSFIKSLNQWKPTVEASVTCYGLPRL